MSAVREIGLTRVGGKLRLTAQPVTALESLRTGQELTRKDTDIPAGDTSLGQAAQGTSLDISVDLSPGQSSFAGLKVLDNGEQYTLIGYDSQAKQLVVDRTHSGVTDFSPKFPARSTAPLSPDSKGQVHLRIIVDAHSVEVFAADGTPVITQTVYPEQDATGVSLYAEGGTAHLGSLSLWHLGSVQDAGAPAEGPDSPGAGKPAVQEPARGPQEPSGAVGLGGAVVRHAAAAGVAGLEAAVGPLPGGQVAQNAQRLIGQVHGTEGGRGEGGVPGPDVAPDAHGRRHDRARREDVRPLREGVADLTVLRVSRSGGRGSGAGGGSGDGSR